MALIYRENKHCFAYSQRYAYWRPTDIRNEEIRTLNIDPVSVDYNAHFPVGGFNIFIPWEYSIRLPFDWSYHWEGTKRVIAPPTADFTSVHRIKPQLEIQLFNIIYDSGKVIPSSDLELKSTCLNSCKFTQLFDTVLYGEFSKNNEVIRCKLQIINTNKYIWSHGKHYMHSHLWYKNDYINTSSTE